MKKLILLLSIVLVGLYSQAQAPISRPVLRGTQYLQSDTVKSINGSTISVGGNRITDVADPVNPQDAVTLKMLQDSTAGINSDNQTLSIDSVARLFTISITGGNSVSFVDKDTPPTGSESVFDGWDKNAADDFSGVYDDLTGKPTIPTDNSQLLNGAGYITSESQTLSIDSVGRIFTVSITGGNSVSFEDIGGTSTDDQIASEVPYSNTSSGLSATNAQTAIDELDAAIDVITANGYEVTEAIKYPSENIYRDYANLLDDISDPRQAFLSYYPYIHNNLGVSKGSGSLLVGWTYKVVGSAVDHAAVTYSAGEYFVATEATYTGTGSVSTALPIIESGRLEPGAYYKVVNNSINYGVNPDGTAIIRNVGTVFQAKPNLITYGGTGTIILWLQKTAIEDCSEKYNPIVLAIGDYYFMYYDGNTQKFMVDYSDGDDGNRNNSDFSRSDRVFLAYKHKDSGVHGKWQRWGNGFPIVNITENLESGAYDVGNIYLRDVIWSDNLQQYLMLLMGDKEYSGTAHNVYFMIATSTDGVNWTKRPYMTSGGLPGGLTTGTNINFVEVGQYLYAYAALSSNGYQVSLYKSNQLNLISDVDSWTLISNDLLPGYQRVWGADLYDGKVWLQCSNDADVETTRMLSVDVLNIETSGSYTDHGVLLSQNNLMGEGRGDGGTMGVLRSSLFKMGEGKWAVFYSTYPYADTSDFPTYNMARWPWVITKTIRVLSFSNSIAYPNFNNYPVAVNDVNTTTEDTAVNGDVSTNDTPSLDGGTTYSLVGANGGAANGTVVMNTDGTYTYTPSTAFTGIDEFTYQLCDIDSDCDTANVTITVAPGAIAFGAQNVFELDEISGLVAVDAAGNDSGTNNGATINQVGKINTAYAFDGVASSIDFSVPLLPTDNSPWSVSFWAKRNAIDPVAGVANPVFSQYWSATINRLHIYEYRGVWKVGQTTSGGFKQAVNGSSIADWQHVVVTYDGTTIRTYLDGVAGATSTDFTNVCSDNTTIGVAKGGASNYFAGLIDQVIVWPKALTTTEINTIYAAGAGSHHSNW